VLDGLKHGLLAPELVEEFARAFQEEVNRLAAEKTQSRAEDEGRLAAVRRKIAGLIRAIEDDCYEPSTKTRMVELEAEKAVLEERLAAAPEPSKVRLHPNLPGLYREKVAALEQAGSTSSCMGIWPASCRSARPGSATTNAPAMGAGARIVGGCGGMQPPIPNIHGLDPAVPIILLSVTNVFIRLSGGAATRVRHRARAGSW
jgi:hypothetical protein